MANTETDETAETEQSLALDQAQQAAATVQAPSQRPDELSVRTQQGVVKAAVWQNTFQRQDGSTGRFKSVTLRSVYMDNATNEWKESKSYTLNDLYRLRDLVNAAIEELNPVTMKRG